MVTELDIFAIKERIEAILENDTDLYDATGASATKLRQIVVGHPEEKTLPSRHAFITNAERYESIRPVSVISNAWLSLTHDIDFEIHVILKGKSSRDMEEQFDDFRKLIYEAIEENNQLEDPNNPDTDPKVATCWPRATQHFGRGTNEQKLVITLHCIAVS